MVNVTALILARGGSVSIPLKNIKQLGGIPLIGWVLNAAKSCGKLDDIWVSTDHQEIAKISAQFGAKIHWRPASLAQNTSSSVDAIWEFLQCHSDVDIVVLLQATSPFLHPQYLDAGLKLMKSGNYDSVFAVKRQHNLRWSIKENEHIEPLNFDPEFRPRRQDWPGELVEVGMFYFTKVDVLAKTNRLQGGKCGYVEVKTEHSLDIDSQFDWEMAECLIDKYGFKSIEEIITKL
uniref:N-acylneuraminate cytidylyltransferase n=1 Tax=Strigamia maritima TaxID=126957 RepID=T1IVB7_STRMM